MCRPLALAAVVALAAACAHTPEKPRNFESAEIHYDLGVNLVGQGRSQEALKEFLTALDAAPEFPEAHNALGLLYHWSYQRYADARKHFEQAVALRPQFPDAWNNLGVLLADPGVNDLTAARAAFEKALSDTMYRTPHIAQTNLAWVLHLEGETARAEQLVRAALGSAPKYCAGHRQLARLLEAQDRVEDADASWEAYATTCPEEPDALFHGAKVLVKRGDAAGAARSLMTCIERAGAKAIGSECRSLLATLPPLPEPTPAPPAPAPSRTDAGAIVEGARDLEQTP